MNWFGWMPGLLVLLSRSPVGPRPAVQWQAATTTATAASSPGPSSTPANKKLSTTKTCGACRSLRAPRGQVKCATPTEPNRPTLPTRSSGSAMSYSIQIQQPLPEACTAIHIFGCVYLKLANQIMRVDKLKTARTHPR